MATKIVPEKHIPCGKKAFYVVKIVGIDKPNHFCKSCGENNDISHAIHRGTVTRSLLPEDTKLTCGREVARRK